jgi:hypothetical protein
MMKLKKKGFWICMCFIIIALGTVLFMYRQKIKNDNINQTSTDTYYSFAIYLLKNEKIKDVSEINISSVKLEDIPFISDKDIISYNWSEHFFELSKSCVDDISNRSVEGLPFVVVVNGEKIYTGSFRTTLPSIPKQHPVISIIENKVFIKKEYQIDQYDTFDPRNDKRIFYVLKENDKLDLNQEAGVTEEDVIDEIVTELTSAPNNNKVSDNTKIVSTLEMLFSERLMDLKYSQVDYSVFFANTKTNKDAKYFVDKQTYIKELYKREGIDENSMKIELTFGDITINDSMASVELYEWFSFMYINGNGMPSGMGNNYKVTLSKIHDDWKIETILSDDEFDEQYYEQGFKIKELLDELN